MNPLRNLCLMEFIGLDEWGWIMLNFNIEDFLDTQSIDIDNNNDHNFAKAKTLTLDLYAGAKECNLNVGMIVGEVELSFDFKTNELSVTFMTDYPYEMTQASSYAGFDLLPKDSNGSHTAEPSEFPVIYKNEDSFTSHTFKHVISDPKSNFNVIAHALVHDSKEWDKLNKN